MTLVFIRCLSQTNIPIINILDAIEKKTIDYQSSGRYNRYTDKSEYTDANGQYYGKSMQIQIHNNSKDTIYIFIPEGLLLLSEDTVVQDMLITENLYALLNPKQTKMYPLYAMCSEIHDKVPATFTKYKVGKLADQNLVSIAKTISESYMQNVIGQGAVWAYTDNANVNDLMTYGANERTIELTLQLLDKAGVKTKLVEELDFISTDSIENKKDSLIIALNKELDNAKSEINSNSNKVKLDYYIVYSGIGLLIILVGTITYLAVKKTKDKNNVT